MSAADGQDRKVYTVAAFNRGVARRLAALPTVWVEGEFAYVCCVKGGENILQRLLPARPTTASRPSGRSGSGAHGIALIENPCYRS